MVGEGRGFRRLGPVAIQADAERANGDGEQLPEFGFVVDRRRRRVWALPARHRRPDDDQPRRRIATAVRHARGHRAGQRTCTIVLRGLPRPGWDQRHSKRPQPGRPAAGLSLPRVESLSIRRPSQPPDDRPSEVPQRRRARRGCGLLRLSRPRAARRRDERDDLRRSGPGWQDGGGGLRGMPRRDGRQQDSRDAKSGRRGAPVSRDRSEGL